MKKVQSATYQKDQKPDEGPLVDVVLLSKTDIRSVDRWQSEVEKEFEQTKQALRDLETRDRKLRRDEEDRNRKAEWRRQLTNGEEAIAQVNLLKELYDVQVEILKTDKHYHSEATYLRTIKEKVYFISEESPIESCATTEVLIRQHKLRTDLMHANRVEKSTEKKQGLAARIENIITAYSVAHDGKKPSANKLASLLNEQNVESPSGKNKWYGETVKRVLADGTNQRQK